jgi:CRP/FNR family transcriptional regulator, cyclic AMP receptor protein
VGISFLVKLCGKKISKAALLTLRQIINSGLEGKYNQWGINKDTNIMIQETPQTNEFKKQLHNSLLHETLNSQTIKIAKHANLYTSGDQDMMVYFIESGQIKLLILSPEGKECILAIHTKGDVFGEVCLSEFGARKETATAMEETCLKKIPCSRFLMRLSNDLLLEGYARYLAVRIADQQKIISKLVNIDNEQRLGETLLKLARTLSKNGRSPKKRKD